MDLLNEAPFLADIEQTPTFLVYDNKRGKFFQVDLNDTNSDLELKDVLQSKI